MLEVSLLRFTCLLAACFRFKRCFSVFATTEPTVFTSDAGEYVLDNTFKGELERLSVGDIFVNEIQLLLSGAFADLSGCNLDPLPHGVFLDQLHCLGRRQHIQVFHCESSFWILL